MPLPSAGRRPAYSLALLPLLIAARPPGPTGERVLDAAAPVIAATIAGQAMRLRVDPAQHGVIELNPAAAARLSLPWESGWDIEVGRVHLAGRTALAPVAVAVGGPARVMQVASHARDCCTGVDGAIGPDLLPYATIRWRRADAAPATAARTLPLDLDDANGLSADMDGIRLRFALAQPATVATLAAGARLAERLGGRYAGAYRAIVLQFGVPRPVRDVAFARPAWLAGFRFDTLAVRTADFGGGESVPEPVADDADIVVAGRSTPQEAQPFVTLGADRLSRCEEIVYTAAPRTLTLRCAFP